MGLAKIEREMAADGEGCLGKAADDEPVFILRAKDKTAPGVIEYWISQAVYQMTHAGVDRPQDTKKIKEAMGLVHNMRAWQAVNGCKVPD